ncbi:MAG: hypothetical protein IID42_01240 [Planctomycetes bacterium]|nr:hypothetical protein [Planctomycetota bacterium]
MKWDKAKTCPVALAQHTPRGGAYTQIAMIRKIIIVVLTLAAVGALILAVVDVGPVRCPKPLDHCLVSVHAAELQIDHARKLSMAEMFARRRTTWAIGEMSGRDIGFAGFRWRTTELHYITEIWLRTKVSLPFWMPFIFLGAYPTLAFIRGPLRRYRRRKRGLCVTCGYDLRGSPERCPECGGESTGIVR